jgi:glucose-1-phosphate cytidylyltransferase
MKVVILAGGLGTRLQEETSIKPKPMLEIGGHPLVWHIMHIYATYGYKEFILALGYKAEIIKNYFLNYQALSSDISIDLSNHKVTIHQQENEGWNLHLVDTGLRTETGGRMKRLSHHLKSEPFMMTYGDGVSDINITDLVTFHKNHGKLVTVTAVRPPARFGSLEIHGSLVTHFAEKPQTGEGWINGGFFVIEPEALSYIEGDSTPWERDPMEKLVQEKQVVAYQHEGFWQGMDTLRDMRFLESLWSEEKAPWKVWN